MTISEQIPNSGVAFRRRGEGATAVVFVHGFLDDQSVWDTVIDELTTAEIETIQLDLAGLGDRAGASGPFTYDQLAAEVGAVVDRVGKPFVIVGQSMGAPIAELVATARPERALGLVLVTPVPLAGTQLPDEVVEPFRALGADAEAQRCRRGRSDHDPGPAVLRREGRRGAARLRSRGLRASRRGRSANWLTIDMSGQRSPAGRRRRRCARRSPEDLHREDPEVRPRETHRR